jgi:hypothetical protein
MENSLAQRTINLYITLEAIFAASNFDAPVAIHALV